MKKLIISATIETNQEVLTTMPKINNTVKMNYRSYTTLLAATTTTLTIVLLLLIGVYFVITLQAYHSSNNFNEIMSEIIFYESMVESRHQYVIQYLDHPDEDTLAAYTFLDAALTCQEVEFCGDETFILNNPLLTELQTKLIKDGPTANWFTSAAKVLSPEQLQQLDQIIEINHTLSQSENLAIANQQPLTESSSLFGETQSGDIFVNQQKFRQEMFILQKNIIAQKLDNDKASQKVASITHISIIFVLFGLIAMGFGQQILRNKMEDLLPGVFYQIKIVNGKIETLFVSRGIKKLSGFKPEEFYKGNIHIFGIYSQRKDGNELVELVDTFQQSKNYFSFIRKLHNKNNEEIWVQFDNIPTRDDEDNTLWSGVCYEITDIKNRELRMSELAALDELTQIPNRRSFQAQLENDFLTRRTHFALVMFDLDHFKTVNDRYGHPAGDFVLSEFAQILKQSIRENDSVARIGGEEFIAVLQIKDVQGPYRFAERIRKATEQHSFSYQNQSIQISISAGIAIFDPEKHISPMELYQAADKALYKAKSAGRNQIYPFESEA